MGKTLYFEGAGCVPSNDVENCRIRTAFTNEEGKRIYIELISGCKTTVREYSLRGNKKLKNPVVTREDGYLWCDFCHYITDDESIDDCNDSRLSCERNMEDRVKYTKANILEFVNTNCNADFNEIVVLDNLAGFRVHADGKRDTFAAYNYGDQFDYNEELTKKRRAKVEEMKVEFKELFNQEYDNTSYWVDENGNLTVRINTYDEALKKANWTKGRQFTVEV